MNNRVWIYSIMAVMVGISIYSCSKMEDAKALTPTESIKDIDGNVYHAVRIGSQVWMVENLKTTKYRNGSPISNITDLSVWVTLTTGAYCWYNNDAANNKGTYGGLYNWYAVNNSNGLAPVGWHIPTTDEWTVLTDYLGGESVAGGKLKEIGTVHWTNPNSLATNESCFTALPGGSLYCVLGFINIGVIGYWWSSTDGSTSNYPNYAWSRSLTTGRGDIIYMGYRKNDGFSVRCIKD